MITKIFDFRTTTGVVGRGGAADPHGRTVRSGVNSSRPVSGRSRGSTFACDGTSDCWVCGQDGEAAGLVPAVLHLLIEGDGELTVDGETVPLEPGEAVRVDPDDSRQLSFDGSSKMVIAGAP